MAKEKYKKLTPAQRKREEEKIFKKFGVGKGDHSLRALIRGQRKINGRLYAAIDAILDSLATRPGEAESADTFKNRARAKRYIKSVPGPPPGCEPPGGGG